MPKKNELVCPYCEHPNGLAAYINLKISVSGRTHLKLPGWKCKACDGRMRLSTRFTHKIWIFAIVFWVIAFPVVLLLSENLRVAAFGMAFAVGLILDGFFLKMFGIIEPVLLTPDNYGKIDFDAP